VLEEAVVYVALIAVGSPAVVTTLIRGERLGGGTTLCLVLIALGVVGLVRLAYGRTRLPRARTIRRRDRRDSP
jgi:hypothetical protein